jgi:hemin uptake protein HemP
MKHQQSQLPTTPMSATEPTQSDTRLLSRDLFRQGREVLIEHDRTLYRLRITRQNKLILTK